MSDYPLFFDIAGDDIPGISYGPGRLIRVRDGKDLSAEFVSGLLSAYPLSRQEFDTLVRKFGLTERAAALLAEKS